MLPILREVRPWRLYENSSMVALSKMRMGFFSLIFGQCVLGPGFTIPDSWFGDLLEVLSDILSGAPVQPDNEDFFGIRVPFFFNGLCRLQHSRDKANRRRLIKLVIWFATFLPRYNQHPFDQQVLDQVEGMYPTLVSVIRQPLSLQQSCAITIRRHLGFRRLRQIPQLGPLPTGIRTFIERGFFQVDDALVDFMASETLP